MRKALTASLTVAAFLCVGIATTAGQSTVPRPGNLEMAFGESFAPKALSTTNPTPISLRLWSRIKSIDGSFIAPMSEFAFDTDESMAIDVRGLPTCSGGRLDIRELNPIKGCGNAIVGEGTASFEIQFPDQPPLPTKGKLIIYNNGFKTGVTTLFAYTYFAQPIATTVTMPIRIEKIQEGRFASRAVVTVPKIANGAGSLTSFSVRIGRSFVRNGKRVSVLTAQCPNSKIHSRAEARFFDGTGIRSTLVRDCD